MAGEHGTEQVLTGPAGRSGQVAGVVSDHGLDQEAVTTVRGRWAGVVSCRSAPEVHPARWGAACGRSAAAAREERCPLGADRVLDQGG